MTHEELDAQRIHDYRTLGSLLGLAEMAIDPAWHLGEKQLRTRLGQLVREHREFDPSTHVKKAIAKAVDQGPEHEVFG